MLDLSADGWSCPGSIFPGLRTWLTAADLRRAHHCESLLSRGKLRLLRSVGSELSSRLTRHVEQYPVRIRTNDPPRPQTPAAPPCPRGRRGRIRSGESRVIEADRGNWLDPLSRRPDVDVLQPGLEPREGPEPALPEAPRCDRARGRIRGRSLADAVRQEGPRKVFIHGEGVPRGHPVGLAGPAPAPSLSVRVVTRVVLARAGERYI